jgi:tRNA dimethylallyltransferase
LSLAEARQIGIDHTRQYAKRQMTWFRHQIIPDLVLDPEVDGNLSAAEKFLDNSGV